MNVIKFFNRFPFYRNLNVNQKINFKIEVYEAKHSFTHVSML